MQPRRFSVPCSCLSHVTNMPLRWRTGHVEGGWPWPVKHRGSGFNCEGVGTSHRDQRGRIRGVGIMSQRDTCCTACQVYSRQASNIKVVL